MADATTPAVVSPRQHPLTLVMPIKSPASLRALAEIAPQLTSGPLDAVGTGHFTRLVVLKDRDGNATKLAWIATYDGPLYDFINGLVDRRGELFDELFKHITDAPPLPLKQNRAELLQYILARDVPPAVWYSAYPTLTVRAIRKNAGLTGPEPTPRPQEVQLPLASVMRLNSPAAAAQLKHLIVETLPKVLEALDILGTVHFGRFLFLEDDTQFAIVTEYDGAFVAYIRAFVEFLGPVFDGMLGLVEGGKPLLPVVQHVDEFVRYVDSTDAKPATFYCAYPTLTVQNIRVQAQP